jgi:hypothetical protein
MCTPLSAGSALRSQDEDKVRATVGQHRDLLLQGCVGTGLKQGARLSGSVTFLMSQLKMIENAPFANSNH